MAITRQTHECRSSRLSQCCLLVRTPGMHGVFFKPVRHAWKHVLVFFVSDRSVCLRFLTNGCVGPTVMSWGLAGGSHLVSFMCEFPLYPSSWWLLQQNQHAKSAVKKCVLYPALLALEKTLLAIMCTVTDNYCNANIRYSGAILLNCSCKLAWLQF